MAPRMETFTTKSHPQVIICSQQARDDGRAEAREAPSEHLLKTKTEEIVSSGLYHFL